MRTRTANEIIDFNRWVETQDIWRFCYPRTFAAPPAKCGQFHSVKEPARFVAESASQHNSNYNEHYMNDFVVARRLVQFGVPQFWISSEMAVALRKTVPPFSFDWSEIKLPFEAGVFHLPKGSLIHPRHGEIQFFAYARIKKGEVYASSIDKRFPSVQQPADSFVLLVRCTGGQVITMPFLPWTTGYEITPKDADAWDKLFAVTSGGSAAYEAIQTDSGKIIFDDGSKIIFDIDDADSAVLTAALHYFVNAVLLITEHAEFLSPSTRKTIIKGKRSGLSRDLWMPPVLGANYTNYREASEGQRGDHRPLRLHWVRGFWRMQAYGAQHKQRKYIWVKPFLRGVASAGA